jgi:hypothetical protein
MTRTSQPHEEVPDIDDVRWEPRAVMVHVVLLAGLILHDVQQDVDCGVFVLGGRSVSERIDMALASVGGSEIEDQH